MLRPLLYQTQMIITQYCIKGEGKPLFSYSPKGLAMYETNVRYRCGATQKIKKGETKNGANKFIYNMSK